MEGKRPIFYERVKKDEVINVMVDGEQKPFYLEMKWVDDEAEEYKKQLRNRFKFKEWV